MLLHDTASDLPDLPRLGLVKRAGADRRIDLSRRQPAHRIRCAGDPKQPPRTDHRDLVAGANGNDAGDEHLESGPETLLRQGKHRRLRIRPDRVTDPLDGAVDVEGVLGVHTGMIYRVGPYVHSKSLQAGTQKGQEYSSGKPDRSAIPRLPG